jgi:predicted Ser/Thr protein kinase
MYVDAKSRQLTMDQNIAELPPVLKSLNLYEFSGALPQSNRGIIEFQDLLKRPIDTFRYLLSACEEGRISVGGMIAFLDVVWMGSTNDLELDEFKEYPDFTSFKARMELVQVPYLLQVSKEKEIYEQKIRQISPEKHVAPHTTWVIALWAILTRLKKPNPNRYPPELGYVISNLTPLEKALIYGDGQLPENLTTEERNHLKANLKLIEEEFGDVPYYEGRIGASPREMITTLYRAASLPEHQCLTPLSALKALGELVQKSDQYMFLKQEPQGGYHDPKKFIAIVRQEYMDVLDDEIRDALGLVEQKTYHDLIEKYVNHVRHLIKNEKIQNPMTGSFEDPDKKFIEKFEKMVQVKDPDVFRQNILTSIASWVLENKKESDESAPLSGEDYADVFSDLIKNLEEHYFSQQKELLKKLSRALQIYGTKEEDKSSNERKKLHSALENLKKDFGYCEHCGLEAISFLLKSKYS